MGEVRGGGVRGRGGWEGERRRGWGWTGEVEMGGSKWERPASVPREKNAAFQDSLVHEVGPAPVREEDRLFVNIRRRVARALVVAACEAIIESTGWAGGAGGPSFGGDLC